jgi:hypothetical protein
METIEFKTETRLAKIEPSQLEEVVKNSGLAIQEGEEIKKSYLPFLTSLAEIQSQATKINFENPTEIDETIARELRLKTVKIRTGSAALKDERKRIYLLRGNLEQDAYNLIKHSCELAEEVFVRVEKAREIAEKKRKELLRAERSELLLKYTEDVSIYPLGEMSEDQFNALFKGIESTYLAKVEAELKAEKERIAKEKADAAERERIKQENERLKKEAEIKDKRNAELRPYIIFIRHYDNMISLPEDEYQKELIDIKRAAKEHIEYEKAKADKLRKDQEEKERLAEIERKKQAQILADQKAKADKERAELLAKAEAERKEKERLEAEIKARQEAEEKAKKDEERKKKEAERKAKTAPDKQKILAFGQALNDVPRPEIKSIEAAPIMANINALLVKLNNYIVENANKL